jgi:hypothetical protein
MGMISKEIVPFGRSLNEYIQMFNLTPSDLDKTIIGVGDGPASFNAEMTQLGKHVVSVDPIYQFSGTEILRRFNEVVDPIIAQVRATEKDWVWKYHKSPDDLRCNRVAAIQKFVADYEVNHTHGRYAAGELPTLAYLDRTFDLALCSHLLFLYSDVLDYDFHLASIGEMLRIAQEVRIFPLMTLAWKPSPHLDKIIQHYSAQGYGVEIMPVAYEFQPGGDRMLRITQK